MKVSQMAVEVDVRKSWWVAPLLRSLLFVQCVTGWQPNPRILGRVVFCGLKIKYGADLKISRIHEPIAKQNVARHNHKG